MTQHATSLLKPAPARRRWLLYLALALAAFIALQFLPLQQFLRLSVERIGAMGATGVLLFIAFYILATVLLIPGSALGLAAGAVFGIVRGSCYVSIASTLGASVAFLIARHFAREAVARRLAQHPQFAAIDRAVGQQGWKIVGLTRLSPVFPFTLLNYAFGLTQVKIWHYVLASWLGMLPGTILYVYLGSLVGNAAGLQSNPAHTRSPAEWIISIAGLVATIAVTLYITRLAKHALSQHIESPRHPNPSPASQVSQDQPRPSAIGRPPSP